MAAVYRFRVTSEVGTSRLGVGPKEYAAGQEFTLTTEQCKEFLDKRMFQLKYLVMLEEVGEGEPQVWNSEAEHTVSGKPGQIARRFEDVMDFRVFTVAMAPVLSPTSLYTDATNCASYWVPTDCFFEALQIPTLTLAQLAAQDRRIQVMKVPNGDGTATKMLEYDGTAMILPDYCAVGLSGATPTDYTFAARGESGTVDLGLAANETEFVYLGLWDQFDGMFIDIDTANSAGATAVYQYSKVTSSGTIAWTDFASYTDGTNGSTFSFAADGSVTWARPGDWGKTLVGGETSAYAPLYYVRIANHHATTAFTSSADAANINLLSKRLTPKDNDNFLNKGDLVRIDSLANATGAWLFTNATGAIATGAANVVLTFRQAR